MRRFTNGQAYVVENCLDEAALELADKIRRRRPLPHQGVVIGYGSGTRTHDADFAIAAPALVELMARYPNLRLAIQGHLNLPGQLDALWNRIDRVPVLDTEDYLRSIATWDISIAPLEPTLFNDAKSTIKYLEASSVRVPSVCSPSESFRSLIRHGEDGMLAATIPEWIASLSMLIDDENLRRSMGEAAWRTVQARYHPEVVARTQLAPLLGYLFPRSPQLNVLVANTLFAPTSFGGATIVAEQVACQLARDGHAVTVFTGTWMPSRAPYELARYEVFGLPVIAVRFPDASNASEFKNPTMGAVFAEVLATVRPDVVHLHSIQQLSASLADACRAAGIPYVITLHDAWWICERQFMVRGDHTYCFQRTIDLRECARCVPDPAYTYRRFHALAEVLDGAALLLTPSDFQRDLYIANGVQPERIRTNKNGIMPPGCPRTRIPHDTVRFAYLGGRSVHKGYFWLKEIFERLEEQNYVLTLVDIHRRFGESSIDPAEWRVGGRIEVSPPYDQDGLDDFMAEVDVLLFPSLWKESFGLSVREAIVRNVWVIATDSGGVVEDLREGVNGTVVAIGDTESFTAAIREVLRCPERLRRHPPKAGAVRDFAQQAAELAVILEDVARGAGAKG
jgi:glycosyltransferase involved in cell wall biosynthesis